MKKVFFVFCLISTIVFAQQKKTLKEILNNLSNTYKIAFSYNENAILNFQTIKYNTDESLVNTLTQLSLQTQLVFKKIDDQNYIIRKPSKIRISICGKVFSDKNKQILPFVNVSFQNKNSYTNQEGFFKFEEVLKDGYITISALGYQTKKILINTIDKDCENIFLEESVNRLSEIIITDYLTRGLSKKKDGSIVLNPKNMGILPGVIEPDILQTLQLIPGVQSPDETASGIHVRGGTPDQNLIVFDGIKMYNSAHFFGLISAFNPYITSDVKLYRSGTHAKYGNNVGGVLDISTDKNISNKFSGGFGTTFTHSDFFIKTPLFDKKVGLVFSARRSITDVINSITYQKYLEAVFQNNKISDGLDDDNLKIVNAKNDFFYEDYHAKILIQPNNKNKLSFSYLYNVNDLVFTGETSRNRNPRFFRDDLITKSSGVGIDWVYGDLKTGLSKITAYSTSFDKLYNGSITVNNDALNGASYRENNVLENSIEYLYEKWTSKANKWQLGYQFNNFDVFYDYTRDIIDPNRVDITSLPIEGKTYNHALFAEYQVKNKKWLANLGIRWQFFKNLDKSYLEPRLNITYKANRFFNLKASTELKHQSISQVQDFRDDSLRGLFNRFWTISDQNKYPILKSFQNSLGLNFQKKGWTVDAEIYHKFIDGILFLFDENVRARRNFSGTNTVNGFDLLLKKQWRNYSMWISYSLSKSKYQFTGFNDDKKFDGSFDVPHHLIWSHNYQYKNFETSLAWKFHSGTPYTLKTAAPGRNSNRLRVTFDDLNNKRLPNYQRVDFSASYKFDIASAKNIKGKIGLSLQNVLNKKSVLFRDYQIETVSNRRTNNRNVQTLVQTDRYSMGFVPNMVFRVSF